ncbi:hypothetical protein [Amycolatopsis sp. NBC_00438]|uniref:hypothetical protein n=1 Tax=Amycolatopsis sp. NBC_00438 TaxID=2903558 RepID=UPI002E1DF76A
MTAALLYPSEVPGVVVRVRGNPRVEEIRRLWKLAVRYVPPGRLIIDTPAADLEVRQTLPPRAGDMGPLPDYIPREHDRLLRDLAAVALAAEDPRSGIAVLVSDSTSGKTRALYEVLHHPVVPETSSGRRDARSLAAARW